ncbi:hypothetical protein CANTEDRAFT_112369 [Yamadazyma tenuis ATCC 10573]|uniref:Uncharacterized protein n=1 Tax=Candida tenuis (strain ATCC 10573 / BCRC 21748 / CBS 615 / JCM 9827 / NBRC 10315 / NRRL Y-1498 / VKM Y-70) TaxID=590646 RepID=G3AWZ3_CANTC|nr:uncharacterized protein CANTEDRAFT_112369 [Yamadazyma tenuis ATCC 10573]EGV66648.1 hypothetical protein CANTEDRAFT_112369 [Yamadazyma tenuis ATCC 10573]
MRTSTTRRQPPENLVPALRGWTSRPPSIKYYFCCVAPSHCSTGAVEPEIIRGSTVTIGT